MSERVTIEGARRLSASLLWALQRRFFEQRGADAWQTGGVPFYVTSNAFMAAAYARVIAAHLRGLGETERPVTILELGAGSGRFAHLFLQLMPREIPFRYLMTDLAEQNVAFWRGHPALAPHLAEGRLSVAVFDAERDALPAGIGEGPLVVIANYFFDGIPHDAFRVVGGQLHESRAALESARAEPDLADPSLLERLTIAWDHLPAARPCYGEPELDAILDGYAGTLPDTAFTLPVAGLRLCARLLRASAGSLLVLAADKGFVDEAALIGRDDPVLALHGSFSLGVNFHALGRWAQARGGELLRAPQHAESITVTALLFGGERAGTRAAFDEAVGRFGPDELFTLKRALDPHFAAATPAQLLALLRLSSCDPVILGQTLPRWMELAPSLPPVVKRDLRRVIERAAPLDYAFAGEPDLAFGVGVLLAALDFTAEAVPHLERSLARHGPDAHVTFNLAVCWYRRRGFEEALGWAERTLEIDPAHGPARQMRLELRGRLGR